MEKLTRMEELEKEAAVTERKGLYDQRRSQRTKVARLARQMTTVEMVSLTPLLTAHPVTQPDFCSRHITQV